MASLKTALRAWLVGTPVAALGGTVLMTVGAAVARTGFERPDVIAGQRGTATTFRRAGNGRRIRRVDGERSRRGKDCDVAGATGRPGYSGTPWPANAQGGCRRKQSRTVHCLVEGCAEHLAWEHTRCSIRGESGDNRGRGCNGSKAPPVVTGQRGSCRVGCAGGDGGGVEGVVSEVSRGRKRSD